MKKTKMVTMVAYSFESSLAQQGFEAKVCEVRQDLIYNITVIKQDAIDMAAGCLDLSQIQSIKLWTYKRLHQLFEWIIHLFNEFRRYFNNPCPKFKMPKANEIMAMVNDLKLGARFN